MGSLVRTIIMRSMLRAKDAGPKRAPRPKRVERVPARHKIVRVTVDRHRRIFVRRGTGDPKHVYTLIGTETFRRVGRWRIVVLHRNGERTLFDFKRNTKRTVER